MEKRLNKEGIRVESKQVKQDPAGLFLEQLGRDPELAKVEPSAVDLSYLSPEQRAESLWATFQNIKGLVSGRKRKASAELSEAEEKKLELGLAILKKLYGDEETRAVYLRANKEHLQEIESINGDYEKYQALSHQIKVAQSAFDASAKNMFTKRGEGADEVDILMFETNERQLKESRKQLAELVTENPELGALVEYQTLRDYSDQLRTENFIWSPSRRKSLEEMELAALSGKPILISGESGTGKTRLVEQASLVLTGRINNETPGKDVRFQDLIAKPKISPDGGTYYEYKEIGEAATGKAMTLEQAPEHDGRIVADDEFNLLPTAEQTERLARIATWTPGKKIRMPVTNEEISIAPKFLYCAMVNLASERYDRKKIPPEVLRKFAKTDVDYPEQTGTDPEIYEMMLAALMDENGRIRAAREEMAPYYEEREEVKTITRDSQPVRATVKIRELKNQKTEGNKTVPAGGFLWRLANVLNELNKSFSHKETVLKSKGEAQYLKDLVIDIGTILSWLKEYSKLGRSGSLRNFIIDKLNSQFLNKAAYSPDDRQLVKEFFNYQGIDTAKPTAEEPKFEVLKPLDVGLLSPRVKYEKVIEEEPTLAEAYFITSEGERVEYYIKPYQKGGIKYLPGQIVQNKDDKKSYEFMGITKTDGAPVLLPYKERSPKTKVRKAETNGLAVERAQEIMGVDFLGAEAVEKTWGFRPEVIPPVQFSEDDLEKAKALGQMLVLRIDQTADGQPLTMKEMNELLEKKIKAEGKGKILYQVDWYKDEDFFTKDTPRLSWALVSKKEIPDSTSKNYVQQTEKIAEYLRNQVFKDVEIPTEYQEAIDEFEAKQADIAAILTSNWQEAAKQLSELKINQLTRQSPADALYDWLMYLQNNNGRLMEDKYTWTSRRAPDGELVSFGDSDADGSGVVHWTPGGASGILGVVFSRSL